MTGRAAILRRVTAAFGLLALGGLSCAAQADGVALAPPHFERFAILGVGAGPQYIGSEDNVWAVVPAGRVTYDKAIIELEANYLSIDLLPNSNWQIGPAGMLRFGRGDVEDEQVAELPQIDMSIDLGVYVNYDIRTGNPRDRWRIGVGVLRDVTGAHDGYVVNGNIRKWVPVGRYGALGLGLAASWASANYMDTYFSIDPSGAAASGLPRYSAGSGWRDARLTMVFVQPVSETWAVGAGMLYSYLLDEAGDSPVTRRREQIYAGIGAAHTW